MKTLIIFFTQNPKKLFQLVSQIIIYILLTPIILASIIFFIIYILSLIPSYYIEIYFTNKK